MVSTRCPFGPEEIITDGVNGLLTVPEDVDMLSDAVTRVLTDRHLAAVLGAAGRTRALDFAPEPIVSRYERLFERVALRSVDTNAETSHHAEALRVERRCSP